MKKFVYFIISLILICSYVLLPQSSSNKVGGVGFRIDDSQYFPENRLVPLVDLFNQKGKKFTYCVNFGIYISPALLTYVKQMQTQGFEIADHSPDHQTRFFDVPLSDQSFYQGLNTTYPNDIDHIYTYNNGNWPVNAIVARICLKVDHVRTDHYTGEGLISISGNTVTSQNANEFTTIKLPSTLDGYSMNVIYIPSAQTTSKLFKFDPLNVSSNQITNLKSFWDEDNVNFNLTNVPYHKMWLYDVYYTTNAHRVMATRTQRMCDQNGITRPTAWIQPGGYHPQFYRADLKAALKSMGYISAGVFADPVAPFYNSYDPNLDNSFGINWEDFNEEMMDLDECKNKIADRFAKHYVSIGHSHLLAFNPEISFDDYVQRTSDLLDWCITKGIPVRTYAEWAQLLYQTPTNPDVNVMPSPDVDLDGDGNPDGFDSFSGIANDGVSGKFSKSFTRSGNGPMCAISYLGGVEKGENYFGIWIKGTGDIKVEFNPDSYQQWPFHSTGNSWNYYTHKFQVPTTSSAVTAIVISSTSTSGTIKIGGFTLQKNDPLPVELSSFKANYYNNKVQISWRTETEVNNYGFEVERKSSNYWLKIGFVAGNGNSNSPKEYSFVDDNPIGDNKFIYRLKQIDNDGKYEYSDVVEVEVVPTEFALYQNYPNPFNPVTKIRYQILLKGNVNIKIFNSLGEEVETILNEEKEPGNYEVEFSGLNISSGVYFYRLQSGAFISTKKMVVIK